jgi:predicted transcriptional regulator
MTNTNKRTQLTAYIVASYVDTNTLAADQVPDLIGAVYQALGALGEEPAKVELAAERLSPARIRKSITAEALISFQDGKPYKQLKRHLSALGMTPDQYRTKWGLPKDYPMVSPAYSALRSALAKAAGLGARLPSKPAPESAAAPPPRARLKGKLGLFRKQALQ